MSLIPEGPHCHIGLHIICPFWTRINFHSVHIPYCSLLHVGNASHLSDNEMMLLEKQGYLNDDILKMFPYELLWDQVKVCNINDSEDTN